MLQRLGTFFLFCAFLLIAMFILTVQAGKAEFGYFAGALGSGFAGLWLKRHPPAGYQPPRSGRFRLLNNLRSHRRDEEDHE